MADSYRYRCGECGHRTSWGSESEGQRAIEKHYRHDHPAVVPGGMVEFRTGSSGGGGRGCLLALGILVVILIIASQH